MKRRLATLLARFAERLDPASALHEGVRHVVTINNVGERLSAEQLVEAINARLRQRGPRW